MTLRSDYTMKSERRLTLSTIGSTNVTSSHDDRFDIRLGDADSQQVQEIQFNVIEKVKSNKYIFFIAILMEFCFIMILVAAFVALLTKSEMRNEKVALSQYQTTYPTMSPSLKNTTEIREILETAGINVSDLGIPQRQALDWLIYGDELFATNKDKIRQRYILATLYFSTNGKNWYNNADYLSSKDECNWGFSNHNKCSIDGLITEIELIDNNLVGTIPSELSYFSESITKLDLAENSISGTIPVCLGDLSELKELDLSSNVLSGPIPESFRNLEMIDALLLYKNKNLTGFTPEMCHANAITIFDCENCASSLCGCNADGSKVLCF